MGENLKGFLGYRGTSEGMKNNGGPRWSGCSTTLRSSTSLELLLRVLSDLQRLWGYFSLFGETDENSKGLLGYRDTSGGMETDDDGVVRIRYLRIVSTRYCTGVRMCDTRNRYMRQAEDVQVLAKVCVPNF